MSGSEKPTVSDGYELTQLGPIKREIPLHWDIYKLGTVANINMGSSPKSEYYNEKGEGLPFFQGNADFGPQHPQVTVWCTNPNKTADEGDLLLSVRAPVGDLNIADQHCCIGRGLAAISGEEADNDFLYYLLNLERPRLETYAQGSTFKSVNSGVLNNFPVQLPPLPEQRRIADILSTVDEQIQQTDEMSEKTEVLKRGLMQDLITGGIGHTAYKQTQLGPREVEIPDKWAVERMDDVAEIVSGGTPKKSAEEYWGGDIVWVTPTDVTGTEGVYISDSAEKITEEGLANASTHMLEPGAVLMTSRATIGEAVINTVPATTNQGFKSLVPEDRMHNEYLYYYVRTIADYLTEIGGGSTFPEINKTDTKNIRIPVPPLDEQKRIADVINQADKKRLEERKHKQHLQDLKRGLMQDLLTGKVRVNTD